ASGAGRALRRGARDKLAGGKQSASAPQAGAKNKGGNDMKSYWIRPESGKTVVELRDAPMPEPGPGQILVRMRAAGLNRGELIVGHSVKAGGPAKAEIGRASCRERV